MSKAFAFKQQCIKADEELRKKQLDFIRNQSKHVVFVKTDVPTEEIFPDDGEYTYQLVEEYEDEERIDDEDDNEYDDDKDVQILLKVDHPDDLTSGIQTSEANESSSSNVNDQEVIQEEVFEYEIENDLSDGAEKRDSDDELDIIPKMVFRKYNKRNKKMPAPPYTCNVCHKVLSNYSSYKYHMQLHSDKKVKCDLVFRKFWLVIIKYFSHFYAVIVENLLRLGMLTMDTL